MIAITLISIFLIAGAAHISHRVLPFKICPICAGVSGTWIWMLALQFAGFRADATILAMLLGGSVVGIAYRVKKGKPMLIPAGFLATYFLLKSEWLALTGALLVAALLGFAFFASKKAPPKEKSETAKSLEKKMEQCC